MLDLWLKSSLNPSWSDLITALRAMGEDTVSSYIAAAGIVMNYDTPSPSSPILLSHQLSQSELIISVIIEFDLSDFFFH